MKIKFSNLAKLFLAGACFVTVGCNDYGQDIENLNNRIDAIELNTIDPLKADLAAVKTDLAAAKEEIKGEIKTNKGLIDGLTSALATANAAIQQNSGSIEVISKTLTDALKDIEALKSADTAFASQLNEIEKTVNNNKAKIEANEASLAEHVKLYEAFVTTVNAQIGTLTGRVEALEAKDIELAGLIEKADELAKKNESDIKAAQEKLNLLNDAYIALETRVATLESFKTAQETINKELKDGYAALSADLTKANDEIATLKADVEAQALLIQANTEANEKLAKDLADAKAELEGKIKGVNDALEAYKGEVAGLLEGLEAELDGKIQLNAEDIKNLKATVETISCDVATLKTDLAALQTKVNDLINNEIKDLQQGLAALLGRIQSVVFVPTYTDGKAAVDYAKIGDEIVGETLIEGQSVWQYKVTPAECAAALTPEALSFELLEQKTRTGAEFNVVKVEVADKAKGIVDVYVNTRNLGEAFYAGNVDYAVSLVVNTKDANLASTYTQLTLGVVDVIDFEIVPKRKAYEIEYTNTTDVIKVLEGHALDFSVNGVAGYTAESLKNEHGYALPEIDVNISWEASNTEQPNVFNNEIVDGIVNVSLKEANKKSVGLFEKVVYSYTIATVRKSADATVTITKIKANILLETLNNFIWTYLSDAISDAGLEKTARFDVELKMVQDLDKITGTNYKEMIQTGILPTVAVSVDGEAVTSIDVKLGLNEDKPIMTFAGFEWGKTYNVAALYSLENIDVTVMFDVTTENRGNETILLQFADQHVTYARDTKYAFENDLLTANENSIAAQVESNKLNLGKMTIAEYLKDVLVDKTNSELYKKYALVNTFNEAPATATTGIAISKEGTVATTQFVWSDVAKIAKEVKHVYEATTWYGQKIRFEQTVIFDYPAYNWLHNASIVNYVTAENSFSTVEPRYWFDGNDERGNALTDFNVELVDLNAAFRVVEANSNKVIADPSTVYVTRKFESSDENAPISADNKLKYNTKAPQVDVDGKLFFTVNVDGGTQDIQLPCAFTGTPNVFAEYSYDYSKYVVKKFDPIDALVLRGVNALEREVQVSNAIVYSWNIWEHISMFDNRTKGTPCELIDHEAHSFVVGNGNNGFAADVSSRSLYGIQSILFEMEDVHADIADRVSLVNSVLSFDNSVQMVLTQPYTIKVKVTIVYPQAIKTVTVPVTLLRDNK